ncbi:cyclic pyranopterin monophosphate synthase MoaC [Aestuariivirga litoralis]|uniref:cyclic pyranopterin monophosphate synthase MoaC n=1 Tax=Aestuariivirga litoralis TaxID=2650924 RepID=UPI0018C6D85F|nr:cyclic pyranopterin monophosphate synthase MoaC [Aestuariivirga litoralis]MBG1231663.1 cyclic pyranopterin monophosphate synthase MoaC [Aestuariivirga litoralis]
MSKLSHINAKGEAHMVDVSPKEISTRTAVVRARVLMQAATIKLIKAGSAKKGDVLATARIAGIMAAKKTPDLIPLCHPLAISKVTVDFTLAKKHIDVEAAVKVEGKTGVEMEAMTACAIACLTLYDMVKGVDRGITVTDMRLVEKTGGKSGTYRAK